MDVMKKDIKDNLIIFGSIAAVLTVLITGEKIEKYYSPEQTAMRRMTPELRRKVEAQIKLERKQALYEKESLPWWQQIPDTD